MVAPEGDWDQIFFSCACYHSCWTGVVIHPGKCYVLAVNVRQLSIAMPKATDSLHYDLDMFYHGQPKANQTFKWSDIAYKPTSSSIIWAAFLIRTEWPEHNRSVFSAVTGNTTQNRDLSDLTQNTM